MEVVLAFHSCNLEMFSDISRLLGLVMSRNVFREHGNWFFLFRDSGFRSLESRAFLTVDGKKNLFWRLTVNLIETLSSCCQATDWANPTAVTFTLVDWWVSCKLVDYCRISLDLFYFTCFKPLIYSHQIIVIILQNKPNKSIPSVKYRFYRHFVASVKSLTSPFLISKLLSVF